ncbi:MAG: alpha-L-fucosidase [Lachnospiraceae bacterium]
MNWEELDQKYLTKIESVIAEGPYKDTWESLTKWQVPQWFGKAKFGIFIHWGLYSVPANSNEWYSRNMYIKGMPAFDHHVKTFGAQKDFGYQDFIPMLTAEHFDPDEWIRLFKRAGAEYLFPVAEHHDGFQMYRSELSHYNSFEMGPGRDILGELKTAAEKENMIFAASSHRAEHWWFMGHGKEFDSDIKEPLKRGDFYWPAMQEPDNQDLYSKPYPTEEFLRDWLMRTVELIDRYEPALLYFDWWIQHEAFKPYLKKLMAYYYNRGVQWGRPVAVCYKHDALAFGSGIVEMERGAFADVKSYPWQTDTAVAHNSWCYTDSLDYKSGRDIICLLIDVVSKNGNLLLNIGPKADGSIPEGDRKILEELADWMKINGDVIKGSKVWRKAKEGPLEEAEGLFSEGAGKDYSTEDFRFVTNHGCIYAFAMKYPEDGNVVIKSLGESSDQNRPEFHGIIRRVSMVGFDEEPEFYADGKGLHIHTKTVRSDYPVAIRIETD